MQCKKSHISTFGPAKSQAWDPRAFRMPISARQYWVLRVGQKMMLVLAAAALAVATLGWVNYERESSQREAISQAAKAFNTGRGYSSNMHIVQKVMTNASIANVTSTPPVMAVIVVDYILHTRAYQDCLRFERGNCWAAYHWHGYDSALCEGSEADIGSCVARHFARARVGAIQEGTYLEDSPSVVRLGTKLLHDPRLEFWGWGWLLTGLFGTIAFVGVSMACPGVWSEAHYTMRKYRAQGQTSV